MMKRWFLAVSACLCFSNLYAVLAPVTYSFQNVTANHPGDAAIGEFQLSMEVSPTANGVQFTFHNDGPDPSVITQIYFYDGILLDLSSIDNTCDGVTLIEEEGNLGHLPGFVPDEEVLIVYGAADRLAQGGISNGVDAGEPGEWVTIHWTLQEGGDFETLLELIAQQEVVIGVHVQAFTSGGSESFINNLVPEPVTLLLLGFGGLTLLLKRR